MSDHDRGAYTPQNDAPLSFDARQGRGRRAFPTTLIISLVILVGLGAAIFMFYRSGVRGAGEVPTPVGSPVGQIKAPAPAGQAQPQGDAAGLQIYKSETPSSASGAAAGAPVFAAGPEQPQPRPAPTTPVAVQPVAPVVTHTVPATPPAATPPAATPPAATPPAATPMASQVAASGATTKAAPPPLAAKAAPAPAAVAKAKPGDDIDALLKAKPAPAKPVQMAEAKPAPAPTKPVAQGAAVVQFGAFSSAALAGKVWSDLAAAYPGDMSGKGKLVESVERDGKTLFRGAVSGFGSHADAVAFCVKLKADGKACIVR